MLKNMKQKLILILLLALGLPAGLAAQGKKPLTLEEVVSIPKTSTASRPSPATANTTRR